MLYIHGKNYKWPTEGTFTFRQGKENFTVKGNAPKLKGMHTKQGSKLEAAS